MSRLADLHAWRALVERDSPHLLDWARRCWAGWLARMESDKPDRFERDLLLVVHILSARDIPYHIGALRWLAAAPERVALLLCVPDAAAKAQVEADAHEAGWNLLVRVIDEAALADVLAAVPEGVEVAIAERPSVDRPEAATPATRGKIGPVGDFAARARALHALDAASLERAERRLDPVDEGEIGRVGTAEADGSTFALAGAEPLSEVIAAQPDRLLRPAIFLRRTAFVEAALPSTPERLPADYFGPQSRRIEFSLATPQGRTEQLAEPLFVPPSRIEPWMLSAYLNRGGGGNPMIQAFAEGAGCRIAFAEDEPERLAHIPVVWGVLRDSDRILAQAKEQGLYWYYVDHAYFSRGHGKNYRITRNRYEAGPVMQVPDDRLKALDVELKPWRETRGDLIIICPPTEYFMNAHGCRNWLSRTVNELKNYTDRPYIVREKPKDGRAFVPLAEALEEAHCLITHSSNVAIEAACLGTPVFVSPASAAAPVGETELRRIDHPRMPDREPWLAHLAYNQFSIDEIRDGTAWRLLKENEERPLA